MELIRSMS